MATTQAGPPKGNRVQEYVPQQETHCPTTNVGDSERWASAIGGGALALYGLSRGSLGGLGLALVGGCLIYRGVTGHCAAYQALGVNTAERHGSQTSIPARHGVKVEESVTVLRPPEELYRFWRNFENLPRIMEHLESVKFTQGNRTHWVARGPMNSRVEWDAEIITDRPNELIGWRSLEGSEVNTAGSVHFTRAPGGRGSEVKVVLKYDPPAGQVGAAFARLFGEAPEQQIRKELRRFKEVMETGAMPAGRG